MGAKASTSRSRRQARVKPAPPPPPAIHFMQHPFQSRVELMRGRVPMVLIPREVYSRMWHIVDLAHEEVGWLGVVEMTRYGNFLLKEIFLLRQEVGPAHTTLSPAAVAELGTDLIANRDDGVDLANGLLFWGHSHVNMDTSPSSQDERQVEQFRENGAPWFVRGILNRLGRMEFTIYLWETGVKIVDAPWSVYDSVDGRLREEIAAEMKEKVKKAPPMVVKTGRGRRIRIDAENLSSFMRDYDLPPGMSVTVGDEGVLAHER